MRKMTPLDIQHKQFDKQFRGFNVQQVQSFLQDVVAYAEDLHKAVTELYPRDRKPEKEFKSWNLMSVRLKKLCKPHSG
ncbi:MAG: DivIVA domain-containing protein [Bdellovibrionota bacterium]